MSAHFQNAGQASSGRQSPRFDAALQVRYSINGGPDHFSDTLNFTSRSLAIRSDAPAQKGDQVEVRFGCLPPIGGAVVRVFPEGFAVILNEQSLSMMTPAQAESLEAGIGRQSTEPEIVSPYIRTKSRHPARARIATLRRSGAATNRHSLSVITTAPEALNRINTVWISADETRWTASALKFQHRQTHSIAVMTLNDWQLHMAAAYGLSVTVVGADVSEWTIDLSPTPIAAHLERIDPSEQALSA